MVIIQTYITNVRSVAGVRSQYAVEKVVVRPALKRRSQKRRRGQNVKKTFY